MNIKTLKAVKTSLNNFGDLMRKLQIFFHNINKNQCRQIVKHINAKLSNTLESLELHDCEGNVLNELKNTFSKVTHLQFSTSHRNRLEISSQSLRLYEIFPKLVGLTLGYTRASDWAFIDGTIPSLTELLVEFLYPPARDGFDETNVAKFLVQNPQIKKLRIQNANLNILKVLSEVSSNIQIMELDLMPKFPSIYKGDAIHFSGVTELFIDLYFNEFVLETVFFVRLDEFKLNIDPYFTEEWLKFLDKNVNKKLKTFDLSSNTIKKENFMAIPDKLPNLITFEFECASEFSADDVIAFIKKNKQMIKMEMNVRMAKSERMALKEILPDEWSVYIAQDSERSRVHIMLDR